jgi:hypothetical protein
VSVMRMCDVPSLFGGIEKPRRGLRGSLDFSSLGLDWCFGRNRYGFFGGNWRCGRISRNRGCGRSDRFLWRGCRRN